MVSRVKVGLVALV